ncbi:MAG TPA: SpoIID/LytB domain-containing protein [bacterium]|nr:SpoIID/LytB domain-containing protein [bacterium]
MRPLFFLFAAFWAIAGCETIGHQANPWEAPAEVVRSAPEVAPGPDVPPLTIRVAIVVKHSSVKLQAPEEFQLSGFPWSTPTFRSGGKSYREIVLTSDRLYSGRAFIRPSGEGMIRVDGKNFNGSIEVVEAGKGLLTVINELPFEDYVMGVLAGEVPGNGPAEALKAQAIAARTFAFLNRLQAREKGQPYDLENTALFQMYQGSDRVTEPIRRAVLSSRGEILTYRNKPIEAFFHSNCGGRTADASTVWFQDRPYLRSVPCSFGDHGVHFHWSAEVPMDDLVQKLRGAGVELSDIAGLTVLSRDEGNRILKLAIRDGDGTVKEMKGSTFRMAIGPDVIRSTRFEVRIGDSMVRFTGKGWGHGVGLCQEGAFGMAQKGYSAFDILRYYYRGVMVERMESYP